MYYYDMVTSGIAPRTSLRPWKLPGHVFVAWRPAYRKAARNPFSFMNSFPEETQVCGPPALLCASGG